MKNKVEMLVVLNDTQLYRNCDEEALGAALSFIKANRKRITHLVLNGDITDNENQSHYPKDFEDSLKETQREIDSTKWLFKYLSDLLPKAEKVLVSGNHDIPRWENMLKNTALGIKPWLKTYEDMFELKQLGYKVVNYGKGQAYKWHDRIFWHGARAGRKMDIAKAELDDALGQSVTTAHINKNMYHEQREVGGHLRTAWTHGGFSKDNLSFVKTANTKWTQGFGVYFWTHLTGEQVFPVVMQHGKPYFVWNGEVYTGKGFRIPI